MDSRFEKYFLKRADLERRLPDDCDLGGIEMVLVLPALAESQTLFRVLQDLSENHEKAVRKTLAVVVVNNRAPGRAAPGDIEDNRATLDRLRVEDLGALRVTAIDASSPGRELDGKEGVGTARKIGLDWGARLLLDCGLPHASLLSLDADCRVDANYLSAVDRFFQAKRRWAAVVDYAHPVDGEMSEENLRGILAYETFLRYHELGLRYAGSPYAFPTIGSTILCTPEAYVACGGMRERQAAEDFYFLQELAKTGPVDRILETTVRPSARPSHRVPFGTGKSIGAFLAGDRGVYECHPPECFRVLRDWFEIVSEYVDAEADAILDRSGRISPALREFLVSVRFESTWGRLSKREAPSERRLREFNRWFDALKTLRSIHFLRDRTYGVQPLFHSVDRLLREMGIEAPIPIGDISPGNVREQMTLLFFLRDRMKEPRRCELW